MSEESVADIDAETRRRLQSVATATLAATLQKRGVRTTFMSGLAAIKPGQRMVGRARTLRFVPIREDLVETYAPRLNSQRAAIESLQPGEVLVIDARNDTEAGTIGDIFAMRAIQLGAVGIVTDGAVRDAAALRRLDIPVYNRASHGATFRRMHMPVDYQVPIACAGVDRRAGRRHRRRRGRCGRGPSGPGARRGGGGRTAGARRGVGHGTGRRRRNHRWRVPDHTGPPARVRGVGGGTRQGQGS